MTKPFALRRGQRFLDLAAGKITHDPDLSTFRVYLPDQTCRRHCAHVQADWANAVVEEIAGGWRIVAIYEPGAEPDWTKAVRYVRCSAERIG